jgi:hypothetical protein
MNTPSTDLPEEPALEVPVAEAEVEDQIGAEERDPIGVEGEPDQST